MDRSKKKNRNKRGNQRGNQNKGTDSASPSAEEVVVPVPVPEPEPELELVHGSTPEQNENVEVQSFGASESDVEPDRRKNDEEKCVKLQEEVRQLEDEKRMWMQKEVNLEERIRLLQSGVEMCIQKEITLEDKLNGLSTENGSTIQKQIILEDKLKGLSIESGSTIQKQVILENKVKQIEGFGDSWNQKEISIKEMITRLDELNANLQKQVTELKESKNILLQENQQLNENLLGLELRIQSLERNASLYGSSTVKITEFPKEQNVLHQLDVAHDQVNMLAGDNAVPEEVALEVSNNKVEPDQQAVAFEPSPTDLDHAKPPFSYSTSGDYASEYGEKIELLERTDETFDVHSSTNGLDGDTRAQQRQMQELDESRITEDVVSVPLDDIQVQDAAESSESLATPLSDAPLIGAPFRLISYFAKYVSGADLVEQNRSK